MSTIQKNKRKKIRRLIISTIYITIIILLMVGCHYLYQEKQKVIPWREAENIEDYTYIDISKMSEKFAYDEENNVGIHFVIETEETGLWHTYLIAIDENEYDSYKEIIDYSYNRSDTIPPKKRVYGYPVIVEEETKQLAINNIKDFLPAENEIEINNDNYENYLTNCYLDTTKIRKDNFSILLCACMVLLLVMCLLFILTILGTGNKKTKKKYGIIKKSRSV